ncbi:MAG: hypothetical protein U1F46_08005 [Marinagarivorans sp.]
MVTAVKRVETPSLKTPMGSWYAAVDFFKAKMAGKQVVFIADETCSQALQAYLSQPNLPLRFALFYSRAVGMSKSILAQRIRAADWLMIGAEAENVFSDRSELMAELAAIRVLVAEKPIKLIESIKSNRNYDFCVCSSTVYGAHSDEQIHKSSAESTRDLSVLTIADGVALVNTSGTRLNYLKQQIAHTYAKRAQLKAEMEAWYQAGKGLRFPKRLELESIDRYLSQLDTAYKRLWDANQ